MSIEINLFGPVAVHADGRSVDVGAPQQRLLLAALAVEPGRGVSAETLIARLWDDAPAGARRTLHVLVTRLRRTMEAASAPTALPRRGGSYTLDIPADRIDAHRFRTHVRAGTTEHLRAALALWRADPLAGLPGRWAERTRAALTQEHLEAVLMWAAAEAAQGRAGEATGPLADLAGQHPLAETVTAALMRALHAAGRTGEAVHQYHAIRRRLAEDLGADPGPALRDAYQAILHPDTAAVTRPVPAQLPPDVPMFAGRAAALDALDTALDGGGIAAVSGPGGAGKTWLARRWAHRRRAAFPDGQLHADLRGFHPSGQPLGPAAALLQFLDALGVPSAAAPAGTQARVALYRSLTAGRRMLVVLDNARDADQVAPLLPGAAPSAVLVTSRDRLTGLVTGHGAAAVALEPLDRDEARELLARRLGRHRLTAEPAAAERLLAACDGLPLALAVTATRAALHPRLPLAALAAELRTPHTRLAAFDDDAATGVRAVLSWSVRALPPAQAQLPVRLSDLPAAGFRLPAVTAATGLSAAQASADLRDLERRSLLVQPAAGRWRMHSLTRLYARSIADPA